MKRVQVILMFVLCAMPMTLYGQDFSRKRLLKDVRSKIKSENYSGADATLSKALAEHRELDSDTELYCLEMKIQHKLAEDENRKIFLNNRPDTAKYFSCIYNIYNYGMKIPSDGKKYARSATEHLIHYRNNLLSAGKFHYSKSQFADACKYFDVYISTIHHPLLLAEMTYTPDADTVSLSKLAAFSAFGNKEYEKALNYLDVAMKDILNRQSLLEIGAKASLALKDSLRALDYMRQGWENDVHNEYFCYSLIRYYTDYKDYDNLLDVVTTAIDSLPEGTDSLKVFRLMYIAGRTEEMLDDEDAALLTLQGALRYNPKDIQTNQRIGNIYLRRAHYSYDNNTLQPRTEAYRKWKAELQQLYASAAEYFENIMRLTDDTSLWLSELRECYYKLNKGKELKKLEKYD